ncbi:MAG TPA: hypothetical protein VFR85_10970 [Anaeromyxobacteraceae bacterium]|nr:hypothetical protein [Anaeromyxobacteraceae bacterium]
MPCKRCGNRVAELRRVDSFERISLADDPADANCGHYYLDAVYVVGCPSCGHRQEQVVKRSPFPTLNEALKELDSLVVGKG